MIGEIALCVGAVTFAVLVGWLIPQLIQLRKSVAESERLLAGLNIEVPLLLQEIRVATGNMSSLIEHARGGVEHATQVRRRRALADRARDRRDPASRYPEAQIEVGDPDPVVARRSAVATAVATTTAGHHGQASFAATRMSTTSFGFVPEVANWNPAWASSLSVVVIAL